MRINFTTASVPTRAAKRIKSLLSLKESTARECTAYVLGYRNWHELLTSLNHSEPSALDEDCTAQERANRRHYQVHRLAECLASTLPEGATAVSAEELVQTWQPSAGQPRVSKVSPGENARMRTLSALIGIDTPVPLRTLDPELLRSTPPRARKALDRDAFAVARKLRQKGNELEQAFAYKVLEALSGEGHLSATLELAVCCMLGTGCPPNHARAQGLFQALLAKEPPEHLRVSALDGLASLRGEGFGWPEAPAEAIANWERLAFEGHPEYAYRVALSCDPVRPLSRTQPEDAERASIFYRMAAKSGHAAAASNLGVLLLTNTALAESVDEVEHWLSFAQSAGDRTALAIAEQTEAASERMGLDVAADAPNLAFLDAALAPLAEKYLPANARGELQVVEGFGEVVEVPPYWIELRTQTVLVKRDGQLRSTGLRLAPDLIGSYPRDSTGFLEKAAWVLAVADSIRYLSKVSPRIGEALAGA